MSWACTAGTTYRIQVLGYSGASGPLLLSLGCTPPCVTPPNDCFANPTVLSGNTATATQSTVGAAMEAGEPLPGGISVSKSVWFRWTPTASGVGTVSTCGPPASTYDTVVGVYTGTILTSLSLVGANDQSCGSQSTVSFACVAGVTYRIQVASWTTSSAGTLTLSVSCVPPCTVPPNDCFALPTVATAYPNPFTFAGSTAGATMEPGEPVPCCSASRSVWFDWVAPGPGTALARTCGSSYDTVLAVYTGGAVNALAPVTFNDDFCGFQSQVTWACTAGTHYRIQVLGYAGAQGSLALTLSGCPPDQDGDGVPDPLDNCVAVPNPTQGNVDGDALGDACDPDIDGDALPNASDNCPMVANPSQADLDQDAVGDACDPDIDGDGRLNAADNCPTAVNVAQEDLDRDGVGDACDPDLDGDGVANAADDCPSSSNPDQADLDGDRLGDACDTDLDGDGIANGRDNCPVTPNVPQRDGDHDGAGDACDPPPPPVVPSAPPQAVPATTAPCGTMRVEVDGSGSSDADGMVARWAWDFGDGGTATGRMADHQYAAYGSYDVRLTVLDDAGSGTSAMTPVTVAPCPPTAPTTPPPPPPPPPAAPQVHDLAPSVATEAPADEAVPEQPQPEAARESSDAASASAPTIPWLAYGAGAVALLVAFGSGALFMRKR
ncbi:MAG: thrombospondin type 3 repeat-containing protein [Thermoplasmatota archaeon]